jgi:hypothetical protein
MIKSKKNTLRNAILRALNLLTPITSKLNIL